MATQVVTTLEQGHQAIKEAISAIQVVARSYPAARPRIRELQSVLLTHLGRQDRKLQERLARHYRDGREQTKMLEFLQHDLKEIKVQFLVFFDKYTGELTDFGGNTFPKDFSVFTGTILDRIRIEEEYLFPLVRALPEEPASRES